MRRRYAARFSFALEARKNMAQILLTAAGTIILLMGTGHFVLTLRDVWKPTSFTPTEESVRFAMQGAQLRFSRRINLWESWLGFNLSHSMGPIMFGVAILYAAQVHLAAFLESTFLYRLENDPRFLQRIEKARASLRAGKGVRLEDIK